MLEWILIAAYVFGCWLFWDRFFDKVLKEERKWKKN